MKLDEMNRFVSFAALNNRSSHSHSVLTVHVQGKDISGSIQRNSLHLVNLTGSDRVDKSEVTGDRLKEAKTLMFVHVSPEADSYTETVTTLKFTERTSTVELDAARLNKESAEVRELRKQVESLKNALTSKEAQTAEPNNVKEVKPPPEKTPHALDDLALKVLLLSSQKLLQCAMLY
ncbi:hypothetical protein GIB67_016622 [Kingdonia uniflora]|uniref:Kinesin motor domain-containing protein n=1 Tax=Kingdonia uniflora TaxID=39325 RepID=A0A7J7MZ78_9MAGN|nr:hypothetical protein GIB67_016622 [Kingdonia uniflora]